MSSEQQEYTCHYGPYKMYDQSGNEVEVNRNPPNIYEEVEIDDLRRFMRSVEINAFKHFSEKIEKRLKNKLKNKLKLE